MDFGRIRDFIRRNVVDTVPDEMDMCLSCGKPTCSAAEFATCRPRLDRAAELQGMAGSYSARTASASRTTASSAPGAKGEASPAEATSPVKGAEPPRPQSAT